MNKVVRDMWSAKSLHSIEIYGIFDIRKVLLANI